jgi:hypothetical protein
VSKIVKFRPVLTVVGARVGASEGAIVNASSVPVRFKFFVAVIDSNFSNGIAPVKWK